MLTTTLLTTAIWLAVTLATQPETEATLQAFYDRVRPAALGWRRFAQAREQVDSTLRYNFFHWVLGFTLVYAMLFGVGDLLFGRIAPGCGLLALSASLPRRALLQPQPPRLVRLAIIHGIERLSDSRRLFVG